MLGDVLVEEHGQVTGIRVLSSDDGRPGMEVSLQATGHLLGTDATDMGTFVSAVREDGNALRRRPGGGDDGQRRRRDLEGTGSRSVHQARQCGELEGSDLLAVHVGLPAPPQLGAGVFECEVDENGNMDAKTWEWK
jgi:hypothetical protein